MIATRREKARKEKEKKKEYGVRNKAAILIQDNR